MHIWRVRLSYRPIIRWCEGTFDILARNGSEVLEILNARWPNGCKMYEYIVLGDRPRILKGGEGWTL